MFELLGLMLEALGVIGSIPDEWLPEDRRFARTILLGFLGFLFVVGFLKLAWT